MNWVEYSGNRLINRERMEPSQIRRRLDGYYGQAAAGPMGSWKRTYGTKKWGRRSRMYPRTRAAGYYGRFGVRNVRALEAPERKWLDTNYSAETIVNSPTNQGSLCIMAQGASPNEHIGNKIVIRSVQAKLVFQLAAGEISSSIVRVALVQDTQANGVDASGSIVYSGTGPGITQLRTMENAQRFRVLWEEVVNLDSGAGVADAYSGDDGLVDRYIKVAIPVQYGPSGEADIADIKTNNLFILASNSNAAVVTMSGNVRIRFTDN